MEPPFFNAMMDYANARSHVRNEFGDSPGSCMRNGDDPVCAP
jgi:hypothetical protein